MGMRSLRLPIFLKIFTAAVLSVFLAFSASAESAGDESAKPGQVQAASIGSETMSPPSLVPILALSVAAITMVRRRIRH